MMGKVVNDRYAVHNRPHFKPPLHALEGCERLGDDLDRNTLSGGQCRGKAAFDHGSGSTAPEGLLHKLVSIKAGSTNSKE